MSDEIGTDQRIDWNRQQRPNNVNLRLNQMMAQRGWNPAINQER